jgi:hypothetical protein
MIFPDYQHTQKSTGIYRLVSDFLEFSAFLFKQFQFFDNF